jgi:hypothetical protein
MKVFIKEDTVDFGMGEASMVSDGRVNVVFDGGVGVVFDGVIGGVSNGAVGVYVHPRVCDSFVGVASRNNSSNILTWVASPSSNVFMASKNQQKMVNQVLGVTFMDCGINVVQVVDYGIGGFRNVMEFLNAFSKITCSKKNHPSTRITWIQFFHITLLRQSMSILLLGMCLVTSKIVLLILHLGAFIIEGTKDLYMYMHKILHFEK